MASCIIAALNRSAIPLPPKMPTILDQFSAPDPDAIDAGPVGKHPGVEDGVAGLAGERSACDGSSETKSAAPPSARPLRAEHRVPCRRRQGPRRTARVRWTGRARPARCARGGTGAANIRAGAIRRGKPISTLESEPMPKRPPFARKSGAGKVPSPRLASVIGHRPATAPLRAMRGRFGIGHVGGVDQAPALVDVGIVEQPLDRPRARPGDAVLDLAAPARRRGCGPARPAPVATTAASSSGVTARRLCGAMPTTASGSRFNVPCGLIHAAGRSC